jgi:hypothetical protein
MKQYFLILALMVLAGSCTQKSPLPPINNNPVYAFDGSINEVPLLLEAGNNHLYMYTNVGTSTSPYATITTMLGKLALDSCTNCGSSIEVGIASNAQAGSGYNFSIESWAEIQANGLPLYSVSFDSVSTANSYAMESSIISVDPVLSQTWTATGATQSSNSIYSFASPSNSAIDITLSTTTSTGTDIITQTIVPSTMPLFSAITLANVDSNGNVTLTCNNTIDSVIWRWNDGSANSAGTTAQHSYSAQGLKNIEALQISNGDTAIARLRIDFTPAGPKVKPTFAVAINATSGAKLPRANANAMYIKWKKDGVEYASYKNGNGNQSTKPVAKLLNYTAGPANEKGQSTLILDLAVDTYLYNLANNNDSVRFRSNRMVWGVGRP